MTEAVTHLNALLTALWLDRTRLPFRSQMFQLKNHCGRGIQPFAIGLLKILSLLSGALV